MRPARSTGGTRDKSSPKKINLGVNDPPDLSERGEEIYPGLGYILLPEEQDKSLREINLCLPQLDLSAGKARFIAASVYAGYMLVA